MLCRVQRLNKLFVASSALLFAASMGFAQDAKPVGMVLDVRGTVTVQRGRGSEKAAPADFLFAGDQVTTGANSSVMFSFCPQSQHVTLNAGSTVSIAAAALQQSKGAAATRAAAPRCTLPQIALGKREIDHIGAMSARGTPAIMIYLGGDVSTTRPHFTWTPIEGAQEYVLTVSPQGGKPVWTWNHMGAASEVTMPDSSAELKAGMYTWELIARTNGRPVAQQMATFVVKPNAQLSSIRNSGSSPLEIAAVFENAGYYAEAAEIYRTLRGPNASDPRFTRHLLWMYWEMGLFAASNDELEKVKAQK